MAPRDEWASPPVLEDVQARPDTGVSPDPLTEVVERLAPVLIARYGGSVGHDVLAEVRAYAWEHRSRLGEMANPGGYLYRVGQSAARRYRRWERDVVLPAERSEWNVTSNIDVRLHEALARLQPDDRTVVVLVHSYGYRYGEVADLLGWREGSVRNRLHRAMARLRLELREEAGRAHG